MARTGYCENCGTLRRHFTGLSIVLSPYNGRASVVLESLLRFLPCNLSIRFRQMWLASSDTTSMLRLIRSTAKYSTLVKAKDDVY
jgi:hypothetical protein